MSQQTAGPVRLSNGGQKRFPFLSLIAVIAERGTLSTIPGVALVIRSSAQFLKAMELRIENVRPAQNGPGP